MTSDRSPTILAIRCPYCGTPKPAGQARCASCGAARVRRITPLGRALLCSGVFIPVFLLLRLLSPETVTRKVWEQGDLADAGTGVG
ncbi:MAG: hypothetical protein K2X11_01650 [Acetobacteraceae bacterium]|nr:hypothetical protein [Acetobacteraceae bacterium]